MPYSSALAILEANYESLNNWGVYSSDCNGTVDQCAYYANFIIQNILFELLIDCGLVYVEVDVEVDEVDEVNWAHSYSSSLSPINMLPLLINIA